MRDGRAKVLRAEPARGQSSPPRPEWRRDRYRSREKTRPQLWLRIAGAFVALFVLVMRHQRRARELPATHDIVNVLQQISYNTILALGQTFVIITSGIDLSVGSLVAMCGVVMAIFANYAHLSGIPLVLATLAVGVAVGALAGWVNALPVVKLNIPPFITTLAMMEVALGLAFIFSHGRPIALTSDAFAGIGIGSFLQPVTDALHLPAIPIPVVWMTVLIVVCSILLNKTRFGRYVFAIGKRRSGPPGGRGRGARQDVRLRQCAAPPSSVFYGPLLWARPRPRPATNCSVDRGGRGQWLVWSAARQHRQDVLQRALMRVLHS